MVSTGVLRGLLHLGGGGGGGGGGGCERGRSLFPFDVVVLTFSLARTQAASVPLGGLFSMGFEGQETILLPYNSNQSTVCHHTCTYMYLLLVFHCNVLCNIVHMGGGGGGGRSLLTCSTHTLRYWAKDRSIISDISLSVQITSALQSLATVGGVTVWPSTSLPPRDLLGKWCSGRTWYVRFETIPGDLSLMSVDPTNLTGDGVGVKVAEVRGVKVAEVRGVKVAEVRGVKVAEVRGVKVAEVRGVKVAEVRGVKVAEVRGVKVADVRGVKVAEVRVVKVAEVRGVKVAEVRGMKVAEVRGVKVAEVCVRDARHIAQRRTVEGGGRRDA